MPYSEFLEMVAFMKIESDDTRKVMEKKRREAENKRNLKKGRRRF